MMHINYAIRHMDAAYEYLTPDEQKKVDVYKGEMYFFRAYVMHRAALLFCEDYDPDKAADPSWVFPIRKSGSRKRNWLAVRWQSCMRT